MSEAFFRPRFGKKVWLTNHAIESMAKRKVTLNEVETLIEEGTCQTQAQSHGWIFRHFPARADNLVCAAVVNDQTIIVKTVMIDWKHRDMP